MPDRSSAPAPARRLRRARRLVATPTVSAGRLSTPVKLVGLCVLALLVAEGSTRLIADHLPAADIEDRDREVVVKRDQMDALGADGAPLVFIGASGVDAGIDAVRFDEWSTRFDGSYNAALIGTSITYQEDWIADHVLAATGASTAVVGLSPLEVIPAMAPIFFPRAETLTPAQAEVLEIHARSRFRALDTGVLAELERVAERHSELVRHRASLRSPRLVSQAVEGTLAGDPAHQPLNVQGPPGDANTPTGQTRLYFGREMSTVAPRLAEGINAGLTGAVQLDEVLAALDDLRGEVDEVVVFIPPAALDALRGAGVDVDTYLEIRDRLVRTLEDDGFAVVDFTDEPYGPELFSDALHLNDQGSAVLSQQLAYAVDQRCQDDQEGCPR
jgi:hypothetical protein